MHRRTLKKPDGRALHLYGRAPVPDGIDAPAPFALVNPPNPHLRWHPVRGEWVAYASHRQERTFLPPAEYSPLAVTTDARFPTELPAGPWDVAVFDNLFPSLASGAHDPPDLAVPTEAGRGACEVVVFAQDPTTSLGRLPLWQIELVIDVWTERQAELGGREDIAYVMPFENRGVEMGVTLHHPHGQIYGYPFVPPIPSRELGEQRLHLEAHGRGLIEDLVAAERRAGTRLLYDGPAVAAFVPVFARYPYEVWIAPHRAAGSFTDLVAAERRDLARALKTVLLKYDGLWSRPLPYLMVVHQAPTDGAPHPAAHLHFEFYPPYRTRDRLKYLAGTELGAGMFASDSLPEQKAAELQAVEVSLE